jgi:hypothetical protein
MSENKKAKYEQREPFDKFHKLAAFMEAAYEIIGSRSEVRCGLIEDNFGGQLFFAYLPEGGVKRTRIDREIERVFAKHPEAVGSNLPTARRDFIDRIPDKISASLEDLSREVLSPLYEETGKKYKQLVIIHNDEPFSTERFLSANEDENKPSSPPKLETHELKHGIVTRTRMKKKGAPCKFTKKDLWKAIHARGAKARLEDVAEDLSVEPRTMTDVVKDRFGFKNWKDAVRQCSKLEKNN